MYYLLTLICLCLFSSLHTTGATSDNILTLQDYIEIALAPNMKCYRKLHNQENHIDYSLGSLRPLDSEYFMNGDSFSCSLWALDPEFSMNATELITSKGYPCENHTVKTEDGYLLDIQRIPYGINNKQLTQKRPVVFLQHGLFGSSTNFLTNLANQSLAYILADAGYDVWLGNSRGNTYGRRHVNYSTESDIFWAFSFDQMAKYDLPATINYITKKSGQEKIFYVGHSQGTLIAFLAFSENKELAQKIRLFLAMAPVFTLTNVPGMLPWVAKEYNDTWLFEEFGRRRFLPTSVYLYIHNLAKTGCPYPYWNIICVWNLYGNAGINDKYLNRTRLPIYMSHNPAGTSTQNMVHFAQLARSKTCQKYDYGSKAENIHHYKQDTPPKYDASKVDVPVALYSGGKDTSADPKDVYALSEQLKQVVDKFVIPEWVHLDFIWGTNAAYRLYKRMIILMHDFV